MRTAHIYELYDNDQLVATGTMKEIGAKLGVTKSCISNWGRLSKTKRVVKKGITRLIYEVYDKDGVVLARGTRQEVAEKMFWTPYYVTLSVQQTLNGLRTGKSGGYMCRHVGEEYREERDDDD